MHLRLLWPVAIAAIFASCWLGQGAQAEDGAQIDYSVEMVLDGEADLRAQIEEASRLFGLAERPPASLSALEKRAKEDLARITKVLRAEGFYGGAVGYAIDADASPIAVRLTVAPGERYLFEPPKIIFDDPPPEAANMAFGIAELGISAGAPAKAVTVVSAENVIVALLEARGFPLAAAGKREVTVDHAAKRVAVTFRALPGPYAVFGALDIQGLQDAEAGYIKRRITWKRGAPYDPALVRSTHQALTESRLFNSVRVVHGEEVDENGEIAMRVVVEEAKPRVIGAGLGYSTDDGLGALGFWEHRNLFSAAERLRLELGGSRDRHGASAEFVRPDFLAINQSFIATGAYSLESTEAFESESLETTFSVERPLAPTLVGRAGASIERAFIEENGVESRFFLVGLPLQLGWDRTDDRLDPTMGFRADLDVTPYVQALGSDLNFVSARIRPSAYFLLEESQQIVLATWAGLGTIRGTVTDDLPADKRFYAGGGGSIRGYGFQLVGPLDSENDPLGGRSVMEMGTELRARIYGDFGGVVFLEGGNVYDSAAPDFSDPLLFGAGFGIRYFTGIGPLRVDLGFPLDRRAGIDDSFQFYVSIGQAF
jgi:translocation and assembly module TamA